MTYYIEFDSNPLPDYNMILQSQNFDTMSECVKFLETHDWYFEAVYKVWQHAPGFMCARIRPTSEKHKEGVWKDKNTGNKRHYAPVELHD